MAAQSEGAGGQTQGRGLLDVCMLVGCRKAQLGSICCWHLLGQKPLKLRHQNKRRCNKRAQMRMHTEVSTPMFYVMYVLASLDLYVVQAAQAAAAALQPHAGAYPPASPSYTTAPSSTSSTPLKIPLGQVQSNGSGGVVGPASAADGGGGAVRGVGKDDLVPGAALRAREAECRKLSTELDRKSKQVRTLWWTRQIPSS